MNKTINKVQSENKGIARMEMLQVHCWQREGKRGPVQSQDWVRISEAAIADEEEKEKGGKTSFNYFTVSFGIFPAI